VQINWPAPAYFTLVMLAGYFAGKVSVTPALYRWWGGWIYVAVIVGLVCLPIVHDFSIAYPVLRLFNAHRKPPLQMSKLDPTTKLQGWQQLGHMLSTTLQQMPAGSFILCDDYQQTAQAAFYTDGQPATYYAGSYFKDPKRLTEYDMWPDRSLAPPNPLIGHEAIYVGKGGGLMPDIPAAFERVEPLPDLDIIVDGAKIRTFKLWRGYGFKGMNRPTGPIDH
jgi:hypothetical protein